MTILECLKDQEFSEKFAKDKAPLCGIIVSAFLVAFMRVIGESEFSGCEAQELLSKIILCEDVTV